METVFRSIATYARVRSASRVTPPTPLQGKPWTLSVTIGGSFDVQHTVFSSSFPTGESVIIVSFSLACQGTPLRDAQLRASLELVQPVRTSLILLNIRYIALYEPLELPSLFSHLSSFSTTRDLFAYGLFFAQDNTSTPVATAPVSFAQDGTYTVSWMLTNAEEGRYRVRLYRYASGYRREFSRFCPSH